MSESNSLKIYESVSEKYRVIFRRIDEKGGGMSVSFNFWALLFTWVWYCVQGMYVKGIFMLAVTVALCYFVPAVAVIVNIYCGLLGNYDYYIFKTQGKSLW